MFALRLPIAADRLAKNFLEGSRYGATPVSHGVALPHYRLPHITQPEMVMVRCRSGLSIEFEALHVEEEGQALQERLEPVYAILFLVSPEDNPGRHLRILANIAGRIDDPRFIEAWRSAGDEQQLKEALLHRDRYLALDLTAEGRSAAFIGQAVRDLDLPPDTGVVLIRRHGRKV